MNVVFSCFNGGVWRFNKQSSSFWLQRTSSHDVMCLLCDSCLGYRQNLYVTQICTKTACTPPSSVRLERPSLILLCAWSSIRGDSCYLSDCIDKVAGLERMLRICLSHHSLLKSCSEDGNLHFAMLQSPPAGFGSTNLTDVHT